MCSFQEVILHITSALQFACSVLLIPLMHFWLLFCANFYQWESLNIRENKNSLNRRTRSCQLIPVRRLLKQNGHEGMYKEVEKLGKFVCLQKKKKKEITTTKSGNSKKKKKKCIILLVAIVAGTTLKTWSKKDKTPSKSMSAGNDISHLQSLDLRLYKYLLQKSKSATRLY